MSEPRRSTRARAREEAAPPPPTPESSKETPSKASAKGVKRKRTAAITKDSTPATPTAVEGVSGPLRPVLPVKLVDGEPLPTLPEPQPLDLPPHEYQTIQQSGVLGASLQRSRATWISGSNFRLFHAHFTPPKKVADRTDEDKQNMQKQKEVVRNFPQIGGSAAEAQLVIEPHGTFTIRFYGAREMYKPAPKKPPQYGVWGGVQTNHNNQYPQYHSTHQQYNNAPAPYQKPAPPPPRPNPPPKPQPKPASQAPNASTTPAPDPVIHMLAQRAGQDPELKAIMKIVAGGSANPEQLAFFQRHITELTELLGRQKEAEKASARQLQPSTIPPNPPAIPPSHPPQSNPHPPSLPPRTPHLPTHYTSQSNRTPQLPVQHTPQPVRPPQPSQLAQSSHPPQASQFTHSPQPTHHPQPSQPTNGPPSSMPKSYHQTPPPGPQNYQQPTPHQSTYPNTYPNAYNQSTHHHNPYQPSYQPPKTSYRPLVFDFVEGNGDKFYFPSHSFMEWLPNHQGVKVSFLITRMKPKSKPEVKEEVKQSVPTTSALKAVATAAPLTTPSALPVAVTPNASAPANPTLNASTPLAPAQVTTPTSQPTSQPQPTLQFPPAPRIEEFDESKDVKDIEYYLPVTFTILTSNMDILQSLPRCVRPAEVVDKYMNQVFDTCERASESTYLAFRLPKEGTADAEGGEARVRESVDLTAMASTPVADVVMGGMGASVEKKRGAGRPRKSLVA